MQAIDTTIANIALPHMQGSAVRHAGPDGVGAHVLHRRRGNHDAAVRLAGRAFGRKRVFLSVVGFTIASVLCGIADSLPDRAVPHVPGLAGAALLPLSQAILLDINPKEKHGRAMAIWGMGVVLGPILGPLLGGWLTEDYSWRWVFFVNVPFGILAASASSPTCPRTRSARAVRHVRLRRAEPRHRRPPAMLDRGELKDWFSPSRSRSKPRRRPRAVPVRRAQ